MAVLQQVWLYEIIGGTVRVVTDVSKYHNAGTMEHRLKYIVFYVKKTHSTLHSCHNFPAGSRQAARGAHICETSLLITHNLIVMNTNLLCRGVEKHIYEYNLNLVYQFIKINSSLTFSFNTLWPRQNGHHLQTTFSNALSWMKIY